MPVKQRGSFSKSVIDQLAADRDTWRTAAQTSTKAYKRLQARLEAAESELRRLRDEALQRRAGMLPMTDDYWRALFELVGEIVRWSGVQHEAIPDSLRVAVERWHAVRLAAALGEQTPPA